MGVVERQGLRQAHDGELGDRVGKPVADGDDAPDRGEVDHAPAPPLEHGGDEGLAQVERAADIDRVQTVQVRGRGSREIAHVPNSGVVHEYVERREPALQGERGLGIAHVELREVGPPSGGQDRRHRVAARRAVPVRHPDEGTLPREKLRNGAADAGTGACHEGCFCVEAEHGSADPVDQVTARSLVSTRRTKNRA